MKKTLTMFVFLLLCSMPAVAQPRTKASPAPAVTSVYTDISGSNCKTVRSNEKQAWAIQSCEGIGGYKLLVADDDSRMSITVVSPDGKEHGLSYWHTITRRFSSLGNKAEWRVKKQGGKTVPIALIVRVNSVEDDTGKRIKSYLAVAKITPQSICVTDRIGPGANANQQARRAADLAATKPCREELDARVTFEPERR